MAWKVNILIASVGGQGGLTLSRVLAAAAVYAGLSVRTGETLGMSQRFGSVVSYVRIGERVYAPTFPPGEADCMVALELTEAVRNLHMLRRSGLLVAADTVKPPVSASLDQTPHPSRGELLAALREADARLVVVPARELALRTGNPRAANMVLLGVLNKLAGLLPHSAVEKAIINVLRGRRGETSVKAYWLGVDYAARLRESS
ncbi:indolepyruvate oxidoreductase subunit beta [Hyperthermus butylicus]|uniref:Indolepyruvate oxidoreductase subunit iorB n=1 Tax=Hyperthermus butylicus (strain DSM 5456 / JCM 9403 / PLM1-5) TaxID=415426 RepID=A2BMR9_HYPBU|nr:indolepyruvate oxidoreductase subunit beta [Hyperthermus butylicus]ABM81280.1 indolepyruvate oxidoreductase subunit iorB [Hyperthermus butylicus DSM 5456]